MNDFEYFLEKAKLANVVPVVETLPADLLTPLSVYLKLSNGQSHSFLLESVEGGENLARYSFIGADPESLVHGTDEMVTITDRNGDTIRHISTIQYLREHFAANKVFDDPDLPSFAGGAIGSFGFSCSSWFEPTLKTTKRGESGEASFMFYRSLVAFDHAKQVIKIVSLVFIDEEVGDGLEAAYRRARSDNNRVRTVLDDDPVIVPGADRRFPNRDVSSNWAKSDFETAVLKVKEMILAGECYQVVLSQCFTKPTSASAVAIYRAMRSLNPSPYMFLLQSGARSVIGASPEMLVKCDGNKMQYRPIAGTRPRGKTVVEDEGLAKEMSNDSKEVAEHLMLVDLGRNDLGRVADFGSITVNGLMNVEKYSHVQHLVSYLSGTLREGRDRFDALASCFPAGTVSGAPKVEAVKIIEALEPTPRGIYAGAVGYFDYSGNMDTCIAIRTLALENGEARIQAGAGIVADSVPELEYEETINKARALLKAVELAELSR